MVIKWNLVFPSPNGPDERRAYIYLPASYKRNPARRYPVLYMFDGHNLYSDQDATYGHSWRIADTFKKNNVEMIVVGLECNHEGRERFRSSF